MYIEILRNGKVRFKTKHGTAVGQWMEKKPQLKRYFVEIDVEEQLKYEDFEIAGDAMFQIKAMQDGVKLSGFLEEYDEDGYVSFRIDESLIGIDVHAL